MHKLEFCLDLSTKIKIHMIGLVDNKIVTINLKLTIPQFKKIDLNCNFSFQYKGIQTKYAVYLLIHDLSQN